jgi:hypothetical protein
MLLLVFDDLAKWKKPARENFFECSVALFCNLVAPSCVWRAVGAGGPEDGCASTADEIDCHEGSGRASGRGGVCSSDCRVCERSLEVALLVCGRRVLKRLVKGETRGEERGDRESMGETPAEVAVAVAGELAVFEVGEGR